MRERLHSDTWPSMRTPPRSAPPTLDEMRAEILARRDRIFAERRHLLAEQQQLVQACDDGDESLLDAE